MRKVPQGILSDGFEGFTSPRASCKHQLVEVVIEIVNRARQEAMRKEQDDRETWSRDNPDLVCPAQSAIVVYQNNYGQAVIRQERAWDEEEDTFVIISKHYLQDVIDRLQRVLSADD